MPKVARPKGHTRDSTENEGFLALDSSEVKRLVIILLIAVLIRTIYIWRLQQSVFFGNYVLDSQVIDSWAKQIAFTNFWGNQAFFRAPLYAYIVAFLYKIIGVTPSPVILLQCLLGIGTTTLTYFYARYLVGKKTAWISGIILAAWPTLVYFEGELMITTLAVFLFLASLVTLHLALNKGGVRDFFIAGIILGLAAITRPTILPLLMTLPAYYILSKSPDRYRQLLRHGLVYGLGILLPILPVTIRNLVVADDPVFISSQGGANFYIGNSRHADGLTVAMPGTGNITEEQYIDQIYFQSVKLAERETGQDMTDSEVSSFWFKKAFDDIISRPLVSIGLFLKKWYYFWHGQEIFNNKSLYFASDYSILMRLTLWKHILNFPSGLLFPLMLAGGYMALKDRKNVIILITGIVIYSLAVALFFVCSRFRQPIIPMAIILASYALVGITDYFKNHNPNWKAPLGIFLAGLILFNLGGNIESTRNRSQYESILGTVYMKNGMPEQAVEHFEKALSIAFDNQGAIVSLSYAYVQAGRPQDAERTFLRGITMFPRSWQLTYNLATLYYRYGKYTKAKPYLQSAIELDSTKIDPYMGLGAIYEDENKPDSAAMIYRLLLKYHPDHTPARERLEALE
nr:glycosyltransferase family 39 protein [candidate division Zixibacteria bacterium]